MSKSIRILFCLIVCLAVTGCDLFGGPQEVKVAVVMPLGLDVGQDMLHGVELALQEVGGQVGDVSVELLVLDSSDPNGSPVSPELEVKAAEQAVADPSVVAYLGAVTSDQARASLPVLNEALIVQVSPSATWPGLTKPGFGPGEPGIYYPTGRRHFFRVVPTDDVQGVVAAGWAQEFGFETVYIVDDGTAYGQGIAGIFEIEIQDLGLQVAGKDQFAGDPLDEQEIAAVINHILEAQPDLLFLGSSVGLGGSQFMNLLRDQAPDLDVMVPDGMLQQQLIDEVGADRIGKIWATNLTVPAEHLDAAADFRTKFVDAYGKEPPAYALTSYEAMQVLLMAIEGASEPTREKVLISMSHLGDISDFVGNWRFDSHGDTTSTLISGMQVLDGQWSFFRVLQ